VVKSGGLHDFYSWQKFPYKSRVFHDVEGVAHNLIHIMCAEVHSGISVPDARFGPVSPALFLRMEKLSLSIKGLGDSR
jgi:hypothetical protein